MTPSMEQGERDRAEGGGKVVRHREHKMERNIETRKRKERAGRRGEGQRDSTKKIRKSSREERG